jgi:branched-chain amino acid transport system ATP-binding protein
MLTVEKLEAGYAAVQILQGVSFDIREHEIVSLLGGNGAGKTTTVKTLSGLLPSLTGRITFAGQEITSLPAHERVAAGLVQVPEGRKVFPSLSVLENLELGSYLPRPKSQRRKSLARVMEMFPILRDRTSQAAGTLSGGEQQMLALARGLMALPRLLILDEPSLGLAPLVVEEIFKAVSTIRHEGVTILLVEQNVHQALAISDRAFVLEDGGIAISGTGPELLHDDRIRRVYLGMEECHHD